MPIKKSPLFIIMIVIFLSLTGCLSHDKAKIASFRSDLQHSGSFTTNGPDQFQGVKWKFKADGPIRTSPILANQSVYFGSDDQYFYAIDEASGDQKWKFKTEGAIKSSAAIVNQVVYFYSGDGRLYAVNASDGSLIWSFQTSGKDEPRDKVDYWQSSPAVSEGAVYFGGGDSMFYSVNAINGQLLWKKNISFDGYTCEGCSPILHSSPAIKNGVIYLGIEGFDHVNQVEPGNVIALNAHTGEAIWSSPILGAVDSSVALDEQALYLGTRTAGITAIDQKTGKKLWDSNVVSYILASPALNQGTLYSGSSDSHLMFALDMKTGKEKWEFTAIGPIHASPATDGKRVYFACGNHYNEDNLGIVYAVDAQTGKEKWKFQTGGNIYSSPALNQGVLYIGNDDGFLYALH